MSTRALEGKVAPVTGESRGIGRAIAERLGRDGAVVAVAFARDLAEASGVVERIREQGGRAFTIQTELGRWGDAAALWAAFDAQIEQHAPQRGIDIIVNNAGLGLGAHLTSLTEEEFDEVFAINVRAPFFIVQQGLDRMRDGGRIINISSCAARLAMPEMIAYGSTKSALDTFTRNLAKELGPRGITANSVAQGIVGTDINSGWLRGNAEAESHAGSLAALGRLGQTSDVADIVAFLASDDARWITGGVIDASGGIGL
ncbi:SDR family oxidoreductase [Actinomadura montaniterrae]|uniref:SDR family oxidoreductase n=1 Tax=Actinomadura montaniterrae TaxID=1803903 RepID=A0A6L3VBT9_9ACTN|nr:SDR family oxidoreductase [Actinomadura montaniterrae]KAB2353282.1 SDR family oxidoreductase [Actinomadura montaniterrae]